MGRGSLGRVSLLQLSSHLVPLLLQESSHLVPLLLQESSIHFLSFFVKTFLVLYICVCAGLIVIASLRTALGSLKEERKCSDFGLPI